MTSSFVSAGDGSSSTGGAGSGTHLGGADAALALDEELTGRPLGALSISDHGGPHMRWSPGMGAATVVVLEGATPEFKIRRVCDSHLGNFDSPPSRHASGSDGPYCTATDIARLVMGPPASVV